MMFNRIFYLLVIFLSTFLVDAAAQGSVMSHNPDSIKNDSIGKLVVNQDNRLTNLLDLHKSISSEKQGYDGFRIQIYSESSIDSGIDKAEEFQRIVKERFSDLRVYLNYYDPDFKIRVGNFRSKIECEKTLKRVKRFYPSCYTVRTFIAFKDLIEEKTDDVIVDSVEINQTLNK